MGVIFNAEIPFIGEIRLVSFNFAAKAWAFCDGQRLPINQNQALFSILGTTYGGDGVNNFALPDLRGRVPIHFGSGVNLGDTGGEEQHVLTASEIPNHTHVLSASSAAATSSGPSGNVLATAPATLGDVYGQQNQPQGLHPSAVSTAGNSQPHPNMQPFLTVGFMIALQGIFPSQF